MKKAIEEKAKAEARYFHIDSEWKQLGKLRREAKDSLRLAILRIGEIAADATNDR